MNLRAIARRAVIVVSCLAAGATPLGAGQQVEAIVASGTLDGQFLASSLFHIDEFWMRVTSGTEFHRWLSQGINHHVVIRLAVDVGRFGDERNLRILSGTLVHQVSGQFTPTTTDVVGRMPRGDSGFVHEFFVRDDIGGAGTLSAITFESADLATVSKFSAYEGSHVNIIIAIQ